MAISDNIKAAIEKELNISLSVTTTVEYFDGENFDELILEKGKFVAVDVLTDTLNSTVIASTRYDTYDYGVLFFKDGSLFTDGRKRWEVTYRHGYATIPLDIQQAIDMWEAMLTDRPNVGLQSYKTGDDSETYREVSDGIPPEVMSLLRKHKYRQ